VDRAELVPYLAAHAKENDLVLVMGARDPGLPSFVKQIAAALS
jgi:hypothetical protein